MPDPDSTTNIIAFIALIFSTANIVALVLLVLQLRHATIWNKLQSPYNFIDTVNASQLELKMLQAAKKIGIKLFGRDFRPLCDKEVDKLFNNVNATVSMNYFINSLENLCAARKKKIVNKKVFDSIHKSRV